MRRFLVVVLAVFLVCLLALAVSSHAFGLAAPDDSTTTTTSVDPPTVPGRVIQDPGDVLTYTLTDPTGVNAPYTDHFGGSAYECSRMRAQLVALIGVLGNPIAWQGYEISAVSPCTPDTNSFTTNTTTTEAP